MSNTFIQFKMNDEILWKKIKSNIKSYNTKSKSVFTKYSLLLETKIKQVTPKRTSTLVRSIHSKRLTNWFYIYTNLNYAPFVENWTKYFKWRKFFQKTFDKYKDKISEWIIDELKSIL